MKLFRFRDWNVYNDSIVFRREILRDISPKLNKVRSLILANQLERALVSVVLNIAEGAYRKTNKDFARFLNQATTSVNEIVSCLDLLLDDAIIDETLHKKYLCKADNLVKQLSAFAKSVLK